MATITVSAWKGDYVGFTGWDGHAQEETKRRLKTALNLSPAELRSILKAIRGRSTVRISGVNPDQVLRVLQILQTCGAEVEAHPEDVELNSPRSTTDS